MAEGRSTPAEGACGGGQFGTASTDEEAAISLSEEKEREEYESGSWHPDMLKWKAIVKRYYPEWSKKSYFVPPFHMNKTAQKKEKIAGRSVAEAVRPSHTKDDLAQQHVLHCFRHVANQEVMFVLSNLEFPNYLKCKNSKFVLPRTSDPELKKQGMHKGDFDILVIHRHYGVIGCEIKSRGYNGFENSDWDEDQKKAIVDKIKDGIIQLKKYRRVLSHILSDLEPPCRLQLSLILPYVDRERLTGLLNDNIKVKQDLCVCLGLSPETSDPTAHCLLSDDMPDKHQPWNVTEDVKTSLDDWWRRIASVRDQHMTDTRYLNVLSRFCGPDTDISGPRTMGEAVSHMADRFMRFPLTTEQLKIVEEERPYLWLVGPPGVGKTVVLICEAQQWLLKGMEVHIVSLYEQGRAAAELICSELRHFDPVSVIHLHDVPREGEGSVLKTLKTGVAEERKIAVVMDEANEVMSMMSATDQSCPLPSHYESFIRKIVHLGIKKLWATSQHPVGMTIMNDCELTRSLRAPPAIARETAKCSALQLQYSEFTLGDVPPVSDGVGWVVTIEHQSDGEHQGIIPANCSHCGKELAKFLLNNLQVGVCFPRETSQGQATKTKYRPLGFKDLFILSIKPFPHDPNTLAGEGQTSPFLSGLVQGGVPVKVVRRQDREGVKKMAQSEVEDEVIASDIFTVRGLERPVVVWVQAEERASGQAQEVDLARLYGMSRSAGLLVCVCTPGVARTAGWPVP